MGWSWGWVAVVAVAVVTVLLLLGGWLGFLLVLLPWLSCLTSTRVHLNWTALHSFPVRTLRQALSNKFRRCWRRREQTNNHTGNETGKCRNKKSGLLSKTPVMKLLLKRSHAACLQVRRMWRPGIRPIDTTRPP